MYWYHSRARISDVAWGNRGPSPTTDQHTHMVPYHWPPLAEDKKCFYFRQTSSRRTLEQHKSQHSLNIARSKHCTAGAPFIKGYPRAREEERQRGRGRKNKERRRGKKEPWVPLRHVGALLARVRVALCHNWKNDIGQAGFVLNAF